MKPVPERCIGCTKPNEGPEGQCPGNMGIGCFGDWRCCRQMDEICKGCDKCKDIYMCENTECEKFVDIVKKM